MEEVNIKAENFKKLSKRELIKILLIQGEQIEILKKQIEDQQKIIEKQDERIKELEDQLAKDSHNSSNPPCSNGFKKMPINFRKESDKKTGAQEGHKGKTLEMVSKPDVVIIHKVKCCKDCGISLEEVESADTEKRQVFDLPPIKIEVTEHQAELKECPHCGRINKAEFPKGVENVVQYGDRIKGLNVYLMNYQLIPYERTVDLIHDIFGHSISEGTLFNINKRCYEELKPVVEEIKKEIIKSEVVNFDETGMHINGKLNWLHSASTEKWTYYEHHPKRGALGMDAINILPQYRGIAVHDYWKPYLICSHSLCNAHHLRDLIFINEREKQEWSKKMIELLLKIKEIVDISKINGYAKLNDKAIEQFEAKYNQLIEEGLQAQAPVDKLNKSKKQSKSKNLLDRFKNYQQEILKFMYDFRVPFDNNLAERDIRMMKLQQKISGTFRSFEGADIFCTIRSFISTVKKNSINVINAIQEVLAGKQLSLQFLHL